MHNWQPIDTAPRDGIWVMLKGGRPCSDEWYSESNPVPPVVIACWRLRYAINDDYMWFFAEYDGGIPITYENPTHWAALDKVTTPGSM